MDEKKLKLYQSMNIKSVELSQTDHSVLIISGYASVYRTQGGELTLDRDNERVNTDNIILDNYLKSPVVVFNHEWDEVIGSTTSLTKDYNGLYVTCEIHKLTGKEHIFEAVQKGLIKSFSIGFIPKDYKWFDNDTLEITSAELLEISLVAVPANTDSTFNLIGTKSLGVSIKELKEQNNLTCHSMECLLTKLKGKNMDTIKKDATQSAQNAQTTGPVVSTTPEPVVSTTPEPVATQTGETKIETTSATAEIIVEPTTGSVVDIGVTKLDLATLVQSIAEANIKADEIKAEAERARVEAEEKAKADAEQKKKQDAENVLNFLREQAEVIKNTNADDLDVDSYEDIYELTTNLAEVLESKVQEVLSKARQ